MVGAWRIAGFHRAEAPVTEPGRLAYIFVTHGEHGRDADDFDPDVIDPNGGENAVLVQPGDFAGPTSPLTDGPTLYHADGTPAEYTVDLVPAEEADDEDDRIGGAAELRDEPDWPPGGPWRLLLRLATNWTPFHLNLGAAPVAFAFLSADGRTGCLLVEDS